MRLRKTYIWILSCLLLNASPLLAQNDEPNNAEALKIIEVWLDAQKDYENIPGISAGIVEDQEVLWSGAVGYANPESNGPFTKSTLCSICSISKLFTSVAIMKLYDEGKLRLDDRVGDLLPHYDLQQQFPDSGPITVRTLLTHSSGLPREADYPYWTGPDFPFPSTDEINSRLSEQESLYPASTYFQYSNLGLTLLGEIVAQVSGMPYEAYIQQNILDPLSLAQTRSEMPEALYGTDLAIGFSAITRSGVREKVRFFQANGITPAAGFTSNVTDLGKFASWQFRLREDQAPEILKPATLKYMQSVHWTNPNWKTTWGLGFRVYKGPNGTTWAGHGGSCPGYRSSFEMDLKNKRAYSVMINSSGTNPMKYVMGMHEILSKMAGKEAEAKTESKRPAKDLAEYTGYYNPMPWSSEEYIGTWNGDLVVLNLPAEKPAESLTRLRHIEGDTFQRVRDNGELGETLVFERDATGKITRYSQHGNYTVKINR
jgi:CubicO group peptidase (beta-lactamase class C family)